jgi:hypothetical protein
LAEAGTVEKTIKTTSVAMKASPNTLPFMILGTSFLLGIIYKFVLRTYLIG